MATKRPRGGEEDEEDKLKALLTASDAYVPYVPLKQRQKGAKVGHGDDGMEEHKVKIDVPEKDDHHHHEDDEEDLRKALRSDDEDDDHQHHGGAATGEHGDGKKSLLDVTEEMKKRRERMDPTMIKMELQKQQEKRILGEVSSRVHSYTCAGRCALCDTLTDIVLSCLASFSFPWLHPHGI